jgi:hypothetical protein
MAREFNHERKRRDGTSQIRPAAVAGNVHMSWDTRHAVAVVSTKVGGLLDCHCAYAPALPTSMSNVKVKQCCFLRSNNVKDRWVSTTPTDVLSVDGTNSTTPYLQVGIISVATETLKTSRKLI